MLDTEMGSVLQAAIAASRSIDFGGDRHDQSMAQISAKHGSPQQRDPRFRKIGESVQFSRKFILTYQLVLLGVLLIFSVLHGARKFIAARRARERKLVAAESNLIKSGVSSRKNSNQMERVSSSSGSSTLNGMASPIRKPNAPDDCTPLLAARRLRQSQRGFLSYPKAFLMYQPPKLPVFNKTLPSNAASILVLGLLGLNAFYLFFECPLSITTIFVFADRAGLLFIANLPLLYLFAAKNQPIKQLTGHSYEALNILHRRLGEIMCLLALLHSVGMVGVWYTILRPVGWSLVRFLTQKIIYLGLFALICYELLYFTSLGSFRKRWYELFLVVHVILQVAALVLLWLHHSGTRVYVGIALAIFLIDRLVFRLKLKSQHKDATLNILDDGHTLRLSTNWTLPKQEVWWHKLLGRQASYENGWKAAEHVFLTVPALSYKHVFQAHPFTIASAAPSDRATHGKLELLVRAQNGFSKDLVEFAKKNRTTNVRLDGPYGSQHALNMLMDSDIAVIVAGGSGIAVAYPLASALARQSTDVYHNNDVEQAGPICSRQLICLIWIIHDHSQNSWLAEADTQSLRDQGVDVYLPTPTANAGRPDVGKLVRAWVHSRAFTSYEKIGVVCSGPDGMNRAVRNSCAAMAADGRDIKVEVEKFGW